MVFLDDKKFQLFAASAAVVDDVYSRVSHITYKMFLSLNIFPWNWDFTHDIERKKHR